MKKIFGIMIVIMFCSFRYGDSRDIIKNIYLVEDMPHICREEIDMNKKNQKGCGDNIFWEVVKLKEDAIPYLIEKMNDTTKTKAIVRFFGYNYTVADISYSALKEINHDIPTFDLMNTEFDENGCGYCAYWQYLNDDYKHRLLFRDAVKIWFEENENNFEWVESNKFSSCDCYGKHPNNGHYRMKK